MAEKSRSSWGAPSRKWVAAQVTALAALAVMWATTGSWGQEETIALIGAVSQGLLSYLLPNAAVRGRSSREFQDRTYVGW